MSVSGYDPDKLRLERQAQARKRRKQRQRRDNLSLVGVLLVLLYSIARVLLPLVLMVALIYYLLTH